MILFPGAPAALVDMPFRLLSADEKCWAYVIHIGGKECLRAVLAYLWNVEVGQILHTHM